MAKFPNVIGCVDGTYIDISTPSKKIRSTYTNRHDQTSLTLQAICDADKRFLDVFTGPPSKVHDSRIFKMSPISDQLQDICGRQFHILADSAYELREWVLTPYRQYGNLSRNEDNYNRKFSATRVIIENAFCLLKARFRQLIRLDLRDVDRLTKFIIACCVLHNICIDMNDFLDEEIPDPEVNNDDEHHAHAVSARANYLRLLAELKRDDICNTLPH